MARILASATRFAEPADTSGGPKRRSNFIQLESAILAANEVMTQEAAESGPSAASAIIAALRARAAELWYAPERWLHAARRKKARDAIANIRHVRSVLFICHGNVCRSPFGEVFFAQQIVRFVPAPVEVHSAGFIGPGRQAPRGALEAARRRGLDLDRHRSMLITQAALDAADLIVVMTVGQAESLRNRFRHVRGTVVVLGDLDPQPIKRRTIQDPWNKSDAVFDASYSRIERCVLALCDVLQRGSGK